MISAKDVEKAREEYEALKLARMEELRKKAQDELDVLISS